MNVRGRVAIAVDPRLLGAALARALRGSDLDVVDLTDLPPTELPADQRRFDLALTSGSLPADVLADVVVTFPGTSAGPGTIRRQHGASHESVVVEGLPSLLALVDRFCPREVGA